MRWILLVLTGIVNAAAAATELPVLVYHDLVRGPVTSVYSVSEAGFRGQIAFLKKQGYTPISLQHYAAAAAGQKMLPARPVMLTFDDGLRSFLDIALPVLDEYDYPAVLSVTTAWLDGRDVPEEYRGRLLTADMLRAVSRSPRVEIVSHSDNLHHSVPANPHGSKAEAAITRLYHAKHAGYEGEPDYRRRIHNDLRRSANRLQQITGRRPSGIAWPYGYFNRILEAEATTLGMTAQLTLDERPADVQHYPRIRRTLLRDIRNLADFEQALRVERPTTPVRLLHITLDSMVEGDTAEQQQWLSQLTTRLQLMRINAVLVEPFRDNGKQAYFTNPEIPARADVLSWVLQEIRSRAAIDHVYLHLPVMKHRVAVYTELARRHAYDGVLFQASDDRATLRELVVIFEKHRPGLRCGGMSVIPSRDCQDILVVPVDPGQFPALDPSGVPPATIGLTLLRNSPAIAESELLSSLRKIHTAGVRHYGFRDSQVLASPAVLMRITTELARHVASKRRH